MANRPKRPHTVHLNGTFLPQQSLWWFSFTYSAILGAAIGGQPTEPHEPQLPLCPCWYSAPLSYAKRNEFFQYNWNFNNLKGPVLVGAQDFFYYYIIKFANGRLIKRDIPQLQPFIWFVSADTFCEEKIENLWWISKWPWPCLRCFIFQISWRYYPGVHILY